MRRGKRKAALATLSVAGVCAVLVGSLGSTASSADEPETSPGAEAPEQLTVEVLDTRPHDTTAFTQGLEIRDGVLYEGTGRVGRSAVTAHDLETGEEVRRVDLPSPHFGEGITLTDDALWQLTWRTGLAFERDPETLEERRTVAYEGEGWGLCHQQDPDRLVMSDGSDRLTFRDPETFEPIGGVDVAAAGESIDQINELECVGDDVYANVWHSDTILRIDPADGTVTAEIDASGLLTDDEARAADVLNGIAHIAGTDTFLITGKLWPHLFEVRFVPAD